MQGLSRLRRPPEEGSDATVGVKKMTTENIQDISREIDSDKEPEQIEVQCDPETGQLVEFHRETNEKAA